VLLFKRKTIIANKKPIKPNHITNDKYKRQRDNGGATPAGTFGSFQKSSPFFPDTSLAISDLPFFSCQLSVISYQLSVVSLLLLVFCTEN